MDETQGAATRRSDRTALLVDDEADLLELFRQYLSERLPGVRVLTAPTGNDGLELARRENIDLIVSDFRMPGMDGIEFLQAVQEFAPHALRVLFTAYADPALVDRAREEAGVELVFSKDLSFPEMVETLRGLLVPPVNEPAR